MIINELEDKVQTIDSIIASKQGTALNSESIKGIVFPLDEKSKQYSKIVRF